MINFANLALVPTVITVIMTTNRVEVDEPGRTDTKWRTNVISQVHAYTLNGKPCINVAASETNVTRLKLQWVDATPQALRQEGCVTRLWAMPSTDAPVGTNTTDSLSTTVASRAPVLPAGHVITPEESKAKALPPVPKK